MLPTHWSHKYVTLWPGESVVLRGTYDRADLAGKAPRVRVTGFNVR